MVARTATAAAPRTGAVTHQDPQRHGTVEGSFRQKAEACLSHRPDDSTARLKLFFLARQRYLHAPGDGEVAAA